MANTEQRKKVNRRELLGWGLLTAAGVFLAKLIDYGLKFAKLQAASGEFGGIFDVGDQSILPAPGDAPLNFRQGRFFLVNSAEGVIALHQACTHLDCLLYWDVESQAFVCPCHGSLFKPNGDYVRGPAPRSMDRFPVLVYDQENNLIAETDPMNGFPLLYPGHLTGSTPSDMGEDEENGEVDSTEETAQLLYQFKVNTARKIPGKAAANEVAES